HQYEDKQCGWKQSQRQSGKEAEKVNFSGSLELPKQRQCYQKPGNNEENIYTARNSGCPDVVDRNQQSGNETQSLDVWEIQSHNGPRQKVFLRLTQCGRHGKSDGGCVSDASGWWPQDAGRCGT